jgi:16S rRNA (cytidine1402-2'-O)-methyltransferase
LRHLLNGKTLALISEAGTPGISDPGYRIVELAQANRVKIQVVPGASSVTAALSASGLPADQFLFVGFLSSKPSKRKNQLQRLKEEERTLVFFEAPHRLLESLKDMLQILGDRRAAIGRELTKFYEEIKVGRLGDLLEYFHARGARGEFTIVLEAYLKKSSKAPETLT